MRTHSPGIRRIERNIWIKKATVSVSRRRSHDDGVGHGRFPMSQLMRWSFCMRSVHCASGRPSCRTPLSPLRERMNHSVLSRSGSNHPAWRLGSSVTGTRVARSPGSQRKILTGALTIMAPWPDIRLHCLGSVNKELTSFHAPIFAHG
jgi:hypothetical protein